MSTIMGSRLLWPLSPPYVPVYPDRYHDDCLRPMFPILWPLSTPSCSPSTLTPVYTPTPRLPWPVNTPMFPVYPDRCLHPYVPRLPWPLSTPLCFPPTLTSVYTPLFPVYPALQISLDLCIPEKELAKTRSQISFIYFQSHSWYSVRNY